MGTKFTELVGCTAPIQLAGMPGVCTPQLAAAVSNAGGLGMISAVRQSPDSLAALIHSVRQLTARPFGVNFLMPFLDRACVEVAAANTNVVEFFYDAPDPALIKAVHAHAAIAGWQIGSAAEARQAEAGGCDFISAQGVEAGGHIRGQEGVMALLPEILNSVTIPVIAPGGIGAGRQLAAVHAAGASGARLGTRFIVAAESGAHPKYIDALLRAKAEDTVITETFSATWPNAPHRVLRSCIAAVNAFDGDVVAEIELDHAKFTVPRFGSAVPTYRTSGAIEAMAMHAGESVAAVHSIQPASEILDDILSEAAIYLG